MIIEGVNKKNGEILKPYETPDHLDVKKVLQEQIRYVNANIKDKQGEKISRMSGDVMVDVLMHLTGYYESLSTWLANEKLHISDLKTELDLKFANEYIAYKTQEGETNETARMKSKISCQQEQKMYDLHKHGWDVIEAWKKSIGRYHDAVRSQLSYERSLSQMTRG